MAGLGASRAVLSVRQRRADLTCGRTGEGPTTRRFILSLAAAVRRRGEGANDFGQKHERHGWPFGNTCEVPVVNRILQRSGIQEGKAVKEFGCREYYNQSVGNVGE